MLNRTVIIFIQSPFHCPRHSRSLTSVATQQLLQEVLRRECYHTKGGKECLSAFHTFPWTPYKQLVLFPYFTKLSDVNIIDIEYHCFSSYFVKYTVHGKLINSTEQSPCWEANTSSATHEITHILWNPKVHYRSHNLSLSWGRSIQLMHSHPTSLRSNVLSPSGLLHGKHFQIKMKDLNEAFNLAGHKNVSEQTVSKK